MKTNNKVCKICKLPNLTNTRKLYCETCLSINSKIIRKQIDRRRRIKMGCVVDVGSGGINKKGPEDNQYKNGLTYFHKIRKQVKLERKNCERCSTDLSNATRGQWCTHHKDHDRSNNTIENYELLCKRCHQIEHKCWESFIKKGVKTISKESRS